MKRLLAPLCALLLAASPTAEASITTTGAGKVPAGGGGGGYTGPGDVVSGAKAFWGLRAYSSAQADGAHKAINIVRASDSQTCDVLMNTSGALGNVTSCSGAASGAVATFCASTTCTIVTWYDQVGTADATQATGANQATLNLACLNGATLPCAVFNGTSDFYPITTTLTAQPLTVIAVAQRSSMTSNNAIVVGNASQSVLFRGAVANAVSGFFGAFLTNNTNATDGSDHALAWVVNGASSASSVDGMVVTSGSPGANGLGASFNIGAASSTVNLLNGNIFEVALYQSALTTTAGTGQTALLCHNQTAYTGIGGC